MRVLWGEIRKLLWWRNLLLVLAVGGIYYWVAAWGVTAAFPNGHPMTEDHQHALAWHDEFGPVLEPADIAVLESRLAALVQQADALIAADPTLAAAGVTGWRAWTEREEPDAFGPEAERVVWELLLEPGGVGWRIQGMVGTLESYRPQATEDTTGARLARVQEINRTEEWRSLQSATLLDFLVEYLPPLAGLAFGVSLLVSAPLVTTDRVSRLRPLQAASLTGRRLLRIQLAATAVVSTGVTGLLLVLTSLPLAGFGFGTFWDTPIQSFTAGSLYPSVTLGQYCWLLAGLVGLTGLLAGLIGFALSRANRAYPALAISIMAALAAGLPSISALLALPLTYDSTVALLLGTPFAELIVLAVLVAAALAVCLTLVGRERRIDIDD